MQSIIILHSIIYIENEYQAFSKKIAGIVCVDNVNYDWLIGSLGSLRAADAFPVVGNSVAIFRRERSDDRKCVCCSQAIPLDTMDYL